MFDFYNYRKGILVLTVEIKTLIENAYTDANLGKTKAPQDSWDYQVIMTETHIYRIAKHSEGHAQLNKESKILDYLCDKLSFSIPQYEFSEVSNSLVRYPIIIGEELTRELYTSFSRKNQLLIAEKIAEFLNVMHSISASDRDKLGFENMSVEDAIKECNSKYQKITSALSHKMTEKELSVIKRYLDQYYDQIQTEPVLCHADLYSRNIIVRRDLQTLSGIIDFSDTRVIDPAFEFSTIDHWLLEDITPLLKRGLNVKCAQRMRFYEKRFSIDRIHGALCDAPVDLGEAMMQFRRDFASEISGN